MVAASSTDSATRRRPIEPTPALVVGPSHVVRWNWHVRDGVVLAPLAADRFLGRGGVPIWDATLLDDARRTASSGGVAVLVGDFRFGNDVVLQDPVPEGPLLKGFSGIAREAISDELDQAMLERYLAGVRAWHTAFGARARYVLWCGFGRQVHDRLAGRHVVDGRYRHPVFNYADISAALGDLDIVDLGPLLRLPMHDVQRLFIDHSNHPSQIGYLLLGDLIFGGLDARAAYARAVTRVEGELVELAQGISRAAGRTVVLTGYSVWLDTLSRYMGTTGAQFLAEAGLVLAPLTPALGQLTPRGAVEGVNLAESAVVVVSAGGRDISAKLARAFGSEGVSWADVPVLDWETATEGPIRDRGEKPRFTRLDLGLERRADAVVPDLEPSAVEQGPFGMPSWRGVESLMNEMRAIVARPQATSGRYRARRAGAPSSRSRVCYTASPLLSLKHTTYFPVYDHLFSRFAGKDPVIVEIGVLNGGSLYMWRAFFGPGARIIGVDLNPEAVWLREEGFEVYIGDQADPAFWEGFFREVGDVDILLDDGGHTYAQQIVTASVALDHIRDGGVLVVEDVHTSYMAEFGGPSRDSFVSWATNVVDGVNYRFSRFVEDHEPERRVWSVQFFESIIAFHVDRRLATMLSSPTQNNGVGRNAKDFRYQSRNQMSGDELRRYFRY